MKNRMFQRGAALTFLSLTLAACGTQQAPVASQAPVAAPAPLLSTLSVPTAQTDNETPQLWFVEFRGKSTSKGGSRAAIAQERQLFRQQAKAAGVKFQDRLEFERLFNGVSVRVDPADLGKLKDLDGVKAIYPVLNVTLPKLTPAEQPDMTTALGQTGADVAQRELELTGKGVKIAIMDTGLDLQHPDFQGRVLATSYDLVGDAFTGSNTPVPGQDDVDDCGGHGTHVAGIAAGNGATVKGVAPGASLGIYRVFGCEGSTSADIMVQAMERVLADGMDVLNMSIGSAFNSWPEYPSAVAASNLVDAGVVVTASIGNSGTGGVFAAGAPGVGEKVIGVANFMNSHVYLNEFTLANNTKVGYQNATAAPTAPTVGELSLIVASPPQGCGATTPFASGSLRGVAVLIERGTCGFYEKAINAQKAGAAAVVIFNNAAGPFAGTVAPVAPATEPVTIPVVTISRESAQAVASSGKIVWANTQGSYGNPTGNLLDTSSSYGLATDLTLKPDLGAPGGMIRATWPLSLGGDGYNTISGTSMASPHVAGVAALVIEAKRKAGQTIRAEDMRGLLQNTAVPKPLSIAPTAGILDMVHRQGAGMVNVVNAIGATARVTPSKLSLGEFETAAPKTQTLTVTNTGSAPVTYIVSHVGTAASRKNPTYYTPATTGPVSSASFSTTTLTVPAGGSASVNMTVSVNPAAADTTVFGGYAVFTPQGGGTALRVPYAGFKGDYQALPVLTGINTMARSLGGGSYQPITAPTTFTMKDSDYPYFLFHLDHFARSMKMDIVDAATGQPVNSQFFNASTDEYLPRNSTATGFFAFGWDGMVSWSRGVSDNAQNKRKAVPNGQYIVKFTVLKALGDGNNPNHQETWTSPVITVNASKK